MLQILQRVARTARGSAEIRQEDFSVFGEVLRLATATRCVIVSMDDPRNVPPDAPV